PPPPPPQPPDGSGPATPAATPPHAARVARREPTTLAHATPHASTRPAPGTPPPRPPGHGPIPRRRPADRHAGSPKPRTPARCDARSRPAGRAVPTARSRTARLGWRGRSRLLPARPHAA